MFAWLPHIHVAPTQISDVGGLALARAAKGALVLSRLNISINHCTDSTLHALAEALRFNTGAQLWASPWCALQLLALGCDAYHQLLECVTHHTAAPMSMFLQAP